MNEAFKLVCDVQKKSNKKLSQFVFVKQYVGRFLKLDFQDPIVVALVQIHFIVENFKF